MIGLVCFTNAGVPAAGLTVTWEYLKYVSSGADVSPQPSWTAVGGGFYKTSDFNPTSDVVGFADGSATLADAERYVPVTFLITSGLDEAALLKRLITVMGGSATTATSTSQVVHTFKDVDGVTTDIHTVTAAGRTTFMD